MNEQPISGANQPQQPVPSVVPGDAKNDVSENKDIAALGYVWVLSVFVLIYRRSSPFARFHASQGVVLFLLSVIGWFMPDIIGRLMTLFVLGFSVWGFLAAAQGKWTQLPLIYALSHGDIKALRTSWRDVTHGIVYLWHRIIHRAGKASASSAQSAPTSDQPPSSSIL